MTYADFFYEIKGKFMGTDVSDIKEHLAFQFPSMRTLFPIRTSF